MRLHNLAIGLLFVIPFTKIYSSTHQYRDGSILIDTPFQGNLLALDATTKPEYLETKQIIGTLYQLYGEVSKGYSVYSGKDYLKLELPETDKLWFVPTLYLSDTYVLTLQIASVGTFSGGATPATPIPELILELPAKQTALQSAIAELQERSQNQTNPSWETVTGKPETFPPAQHTHTQAHITGLSESMEGIRSSASSLASRVQTLESKPASAWADITSKPTSFTPSSHTHNQSEITGLSDSLTSIQSSASSLASRVQTLEATQSTSQSESSVLLTQSATLQANKRYLVRSADLVLSLPVNPAIGDTLEVQTGNFDARIVHGNTATRVLNNNTLTTAGTDSGLICKAYSLVKLLFLGADLWISQLRVRTVNNWLAQSIEATANRKTYTATAPAAAYSAVIAGAYNGVKTTGALTNGYLSDVTSGNILITLATPIILSQIRLVNGQANNGGGRDDPYSVRDMIIHVSHNVSGENLGTYTFSNTNTTEEVKNIQPNTTPSTQFLIRVNTITNRPIGILELELWGRAATGGEVAV